MSDTPTPQLQADPERPESEQTTPDAQATPTPATPETEEPNVESVELQPEDLPADLLNQLGLNTEDENPVTVNPATFGNLSPQSNGHSRRASLEMLLDINLQVTVELGRARMTIKEVLGLGPGAVVELNRVAGEPVDVLVNGKPVAKGEVVVIGDMFGVRITDIIPPSQRMAHLF